MGATSEYAEFPITSSGAAPGVGVRAEGAGALPSMSVEMDGSVVTLPVASECAPIRSASCRRIDESSARDCSGADDLVTGDSLPGSRGGCVPSRCVPDIRRNCSTRASCNGALERPLPRAEAGRVSRALGGPGASGGAERSTPAAMSPAPGEPRSRCSDSTTSGRTRRPRPPGPVDGPAVVSPRTPATGSRIKAVASASDDSDVDSSRSVAGLTATAAGRPGRT
jgi:hypothetical protein